MDFGNILKFILGGPQAQSSLARPAADAIASALPHTYSGTPIRDLLVGQAYASGPTQSVQGASTQNTQVYGPQRPYGPQNPGGAAPTSGGQSGGAPQQTTGTNNNTGGGQPVDPYLQQLQNAYGAVKDSLNNTIPTYEADFNQYKTDAGNAINDAQNTLTNQVGDINRNYGNTLKQTLQTNKDIASKINNTYSALGTIDSSAYGNDITKQNQSLQNDINNINLNQTKDTNAANQTFTNFKNNIQSGINNYEQEINRAKEGVRQAVANADMSSAGALTNYINQLQSQQQNLQTMGANLKLSLAGLAGQGVDVANNLKNINGLDFGNVFGQQLAGQLGLANNTYTTPTQGPLSGQGYINPATGMPYTKDQLTALGITQ